jgi:spermidine synthase
MLDKLKHFFHYYTVKEGRSPINGLYKVVMVFDRPRLVIGNMVQSGGGVRKIWHKAVASLKQNNVKVNNALIVGLGCGDCAFEIAAHYPKAKMLGVEIDRHIIEAARCYFDLATVKNLNITIAEGAGYVQKLTKKKRLKKFDLVIVDAFIESKIPKKFSSKKFSQDLTKLLSHNGVVIYNHLFYDQFKQEAEKFIKELEGVFGKITLQRTGSNLLIFCWY